ncbi:tetratricopeptide repeat protein [Cytobacillus firmus]|uniref:Tetratricopeptide repeat protein n=2 Tax=Cytobacillus TaxID=2675230 RepID=A0A366K4C5_CYTFI|nr:MULTISPECIES: helix-turn-helix domain-containing protein [Cytobacillus]RBP96609.1 tetratricopeptide repeat protein [Cytobacillus firmus]TDX45664.1 tetratricopeptide repeat protein [Cytobacillus oceanisediminis]
MLEGEIIKFYREKSGLTQAMLGEGICTPTHVSKIERGKTAYSPEIISLFSAVLNIDIQTEIEYFRDLDKRLQDWHKAIIMYRIARAEEIKNELESSPFIQSSKYAAHYLLLKARYHLLHQELEEASRIIKQVSNVFPSLPLFERNLFYHVQGMYYINQAIKPDCADQQKALQVLKNININEYGNEEYFYHLAIAYHYIDSKIMAYMFAEKSLQHFKNTNNYTMAIKAESIILLQISSDILTDMDKLAERYHHLIWDCERIGFHDYKGLLYNNLGFEYFNREQYAKAKECYKQALRLADRNTIIYLQRLYSYLNSCIEGKLSGKTALLKKACEGIQVSKELKSTLYLSLFKLSKYQLFHQREKYFKYLEEKAFPEFVKIKHMILMRRFGKKLYEYYIETGNHEKAIHLNSQLEGNELINV